MSTILYILSSTTTTTTETMEKKEKIKYLLTIAIIIWTEKTTTIATITTCVTSIIIIIIIIKATKSHYYDEYNDCTHCKLYLYTRIPTANNSHLKLNGSWDCFPTNAITSSRVHVALKVCNGQNIDLFRFASSKTL